MSGKQFAIIIIITFIVGIAWLVSDIILNTKPSIPVNPQQENLLKELNPNFNPRVLDIIDKDVIDYNLTQSQITLPAVIPKLENSSESGVISQ